MGAPNQADEWKQATAQFLASPEGQNWPGGSNNLQILGWLLRENGLVDVENKVEALQHVAAEMRDRGLLDGMSERTRAVSPNDSPAETLLKWKAAYDDPVKAGEAFRKFFTK